MSLPITEVPLLDDQPAPYHVATHEVVHWTVDTPHGSIDAYKTSVGPMDNCVYVLVAPDATILIDAAADAEHLLELVDTVSERPLDAVLTTHRHGDHLQATKAVVSATGAAHYAPAEEAEAIAEGSGTAVDHELTAGTGAVRLGSVTLDAVSLRGHTPSALCYVLDGSPATHLFIGDSLFPGGVGKTTSTADFERLLGDLESKIFGAYPDSAVVHPGHGDATTLGAERPHIPEWRERGW